jgi:hypothetical protein
VSGVRTKATARRHTRPPYLRHSRLTPLQCIPDLDRPLWGANPLGCSPQVLLLGGGGDAEEAEPDGPHGLRGAGDDHAVCARAAAVHGLHQNVSPQHKKVRTISPPVHHVPDGLATGFVLSCRYGYFQPYVEDSDDVLAETSQYAIWFTLLSALLMKAQVSAARTDAFAWVLVLINILTFFVVIITLVVQLLQTRDRLKDIAARLNIAEHLEVFMSPSRRESRANTPEPPTEVFNTLQPTTEAQIALQPPPIVTTPPDAPGREDAEAG